MAGLMAADAAVLPVHGACSVLIDGDDKHNHRSLGPRGNEVN
jgi:hypothetical protein